MKIAVLLLSCISLAACADKGKCLQSHTERVDGYYYTTFIMSGQTMIPITHYSPPYDKTVCDRWEFPDGKPKEK